MDGQQHIKKAACKWWIRGSKQFTVPHEVKNVHICYEPRTSFTVFTTANHHTLFGASCNHSLKLQTLRLYQPLHVIPPSTLLPSKFSIPSGFPIKILYAFLFSPHKSPQLFHPSTIRWKQILRSSLCRQVESLARNESIRRGVKVQSCSFLTSAITEKGG